MIPADLSEALATAVARWDGRGPTVDDALRAGKELASAAMAVLVWDSAEASKDSVPR